MLQVKICKLSVDNFLSLDTRMLSFVENWNDRLDSLILIFFDETLKEGDLAVKF